MSAPWTKATVACPECRAGKHGNCVGWAIDSRDQEVACPCADANHGAATMGITS
jgi:hypothetical protein